MTNDRVNQIFHQTIKNFQDLAILLAMKSCDEKKQSVVAQGKKQAEMPKKESREGRN